MTTTIAMAISAYWVYRNRRERGSHTKAGSITNPHTTCKTATKRSRYITHDSAANPRKTASRRHHRWKPDNLRERLILTTSSFAFGYVVLGGGKTIECLIRKALHDKSPVHGKRN
jgi:acyl-ACP thioesterase